MQKFELVRKFLVCDVNKNGELSNSGIPIPAPFDADDKTVMNYLGLQFGWSMKPLGNGVYTNQYGKIRMKVYRTYIDEIYYRLLFINRIFPQIRTQQIMSMAANKAGWKNNDLFYCEDATLIKGLQMVVDEYKLDECKHKSSK